MRQHHIVGLMAMGCLNGIFSPLMPYVLIFNALWYPAFLPGSLGVLTTITSIVTATATIMVAGIPAAIYERVTGAEESDGTSALIWIGALAIITVPALLVLVRGGFV